MVVNLPEFAVASAAATTPWRLRADAALLPEIGLVRDCVVTVVGELITAVDFGVTEEALSPGTFVDAAGCTLVPGLVDVHTHLTFPGNADPVATIRSESEHGMIVRALGNAQDALAHGITTMVDCGSKGATLLSLRDAIDSQLALGPRLLVAGAPITTTAGHCHWLGGQADTTDEVIRLARTLVQDGVDILKLMLTGGNMTARSNTKQLQYPQATVLALGEEARRMDIPLVVHAHTEQACQLAAQAGARIVAHCTCATGDSIGLADDTLRALVGSGCYVDPTLMVGAGPNHAPERSRIRAQMLPLLRRMRDAGVPLLAGTDGGSTNVGHAHVAGSVAALHTEVGLSLTDALYAATELPARAVGRTHQFGKIATGLSADFVVVPGDLSDGAAALYRPRAVYLRGRLVAADGRLLALNGPSAVNHILASSKPNGGPVRA